jgi:putative Holliday junction resolvase
MDGSIGFQAQYCLDFKAMLEEHIKLPVIMIDERMTSRMAHNTMLKADMSRNKRKQNVDKLAATIILQSYLDSLPRY